MQQRWNREIYLLVLTIAVVVTFPADFFAQHNCPFNSNLLRVVDSEGRFGFIDHQGKVVIHPSQLPERTVLVNDFYEGLASIGVNPVGNELAGYSPGKTEMGFIDISGRVVIRPQFDYAYGFCGGYARVEKDEFTGYIDKASNVVIDLKLDCSEYTRFTDTLRFGRCITRSLKPAQVFGEYAEGLMAASDGSTGPRARYGFMDINGKMVIQPQFEPEIEHHGGIRYMTRFSEGRALVKMDGKYGYIDKRGKVIIKARFSSGSEFSEGLAFVVEGDTRGYVNKSGRWVIKLPASTDGRPFRGGVAAISVRASRTGVLGRESVWGYIDRTGRRVIEPKFDGAADFVNGIARVYELTPNLPNWESQFGYIDRTGRYIWKPGTSLGEPDPKRASTNTPPPKGSDRPN